MSVERLMELMKKHIILHETLLQIAMKKTSVLVNKNITELHQLINKEQSAITIIQQVENERMKVVTQLLGNSSKELTLQSCMNHCNKSEQEILQTLQNKLLDVIVELKKANDLNQQLTEQSMHFLNISLDMFLPERQFAQYGQSSTEQLPDEKPLSIFDSKA